MAMQGVPTVKKKLELLEQLQGSDKGIDEQLSAQNEHRAAISRLTEDLAALQRALVERQEEMASLRQEKAALEAALHTEQENIRRSETNMKEIRTNKEFQAVGREITTARKQVADIEEQLLQLVSRMDELQAAVDTLLGEYSASEATTAQGIAEMQQAIDSLQQAIDTAVAGREAIAKSLGSNLVRRYNQLREQRRGQALAEARDGSCTGCNMQLPPQMYNTLFRMEEIFFCPHCQRILILKQEQPT